MTDGPPLVQPRKAVIPAAGLGTRFLPATKAVPKELMPVVDTPAIQYVAEEAVRSGLDELLIITARGKDAIVDHFDRVPELEAALEAKGDTVRLAAVRRSTELARVHFVRQLEPAGLGHALLCAAPYVGEEPFAVLLGDDLIDERDSLLAQMLAVHAERGGCVLALIRVPPEAVSLYGCVAVEPASGSGPDRPGDVVRITDLVEKPDPDTAPSDLAIIGRYVLPPRIFDALAKTPPGRGGEIQLTDALRALAEAGEPVHGVIFTGRRYDTGDQIDYLRTVVRLACEREDIGPGFRNWLVDFVAGLS
ncbi:MAG TPA: UTP--glucose-1-phosphate uridylyltransferase [Mycobacteriales bacterium]|nr:UTP--glucose-1-phosphate uridylyltransferase [Mycobacteriales bacterium]